MRSLPRTLVLGVLGLALAACGGGGDDGNFLDLGDDTPTPKPTATSPAVFGGGGSTTPGAGRTPTPADLNVTPTPYPAGPEGAVNLETIGRKPSGSSEVGDSGDDQAPPPIGPWVTPLIAWDAIGSKFGEDRGEPLVHGGIDFRTDSTPGVDVYAVCDGYVAGIDYSETHGRYIVLKCPEKWTVVYGYMEIVDVEVDEEVVKGETVLGTVGAFLHFEMRWDFKPVDPDSQLQFHVRPKGILLDPTPTPVDPEDTEEPEDTPTPEPAATDTPGGGGPAATPTPSGPPTATPTPSNTPTPEPTPTPTPKPPTPTPTPLPQGF